MLTAGKALTVTAVVVLLQLVVEEVNVNVAEPAATPVTTPAEVIVATDGLLLTQVPPVVGDKVVVDPIHIELLPVMLTVGKTFTVTAVVVLLQLVVEEVNVNVAEPAATPVTTPAEVTVATDGLLLTHVPPVVGDKVVVAPMHIELLPVMLTVGKALTVTAVVVLLQLVVDEVNVNVAEPAATPVTTPAEVIVATDGLLLTQVPPVVGDKVVVDPIHIELLPVMLTVGKTFTVTAVVVLLQLVVDEVNVKVALPAVKPVTIPPALTDATAGLLLTHVPPVVGESVVVAPMQIELLPVMLTVGKALTVTAVVVLLQLVVDEVNVKVADPAATPVTTPAEVTVANDVLLLTHVPPVVGDNVVVAPMQIELLPVMLTAGKALTVTVPVVLLQLVVADVNVKVADPAATPVTTPAEVTVATAGLLLTQVPPVVGDNVVVAPMQIELLPVMLTVGNGLTVTVPVVLLQLVVDEV